MNEIEIKDINEENLQDIPAFCRGCVHWEFPEEFKKAKKDQSSAQELNLEEKKREWFAQTLKEFGTCGKIVYHKGKPVAYTQFAPSVCLPNLNEYQSKMFGTIEEGVVFLSCLYVADESLRRRGLGNALLKNIISNLKMRGFKSVETIARRGDPNNSSGPLELYIKNGFTFKDKTNPDQPLLRLFL